MKTDVTAVWSRARDPDLTVLCNNTLTRTLLSGERILLPLIVKSNKTLWRRPRVGTFLLSHSCTSYQPGPFGELSKSSLKENDSELLDENVGRKSGLSSLSSADWLFAVCHSNLCDTLIQLADRCGISRIMKSPVCYKL